MRMQIKSLFFALLLVGLIVSAASATSVPIETNKTYVVEPTGTTPFNIWAGAILLGVALVIISFAKWPDGTEGLISIISWIPIGFAMYTSFAVDRITSTGYSAASDGTPILIEMHTVSSYATVAIFLFVFLIFAIGNTWRIYGNQAEAAAQVKFTERNRFMNQEGFVTYDE